MNTTPTQAELAAEIRRARRELQRSAIACDMLLRECEQFEPVRHWQVSAQRHRLRELHLAELINQYVEAFGE